MRWSGCELAQGAAGALVGELVCALAGLGLRLMYRWRLGEGLHVLGVLRNVLRNVLHLVQLFHPLRSSWGPPVEVRLGLGMVLGMQQVRLPTHHWLPMRVLGVRVRLGILREGGHHASRGSIEASHHRSGCRIPRQRSRQLSTSVKVLWKNVSERTHIRFAPQCTRRCSP